MPSTPTYALPYQSLADPPDGPNLGEDLALAVEAQLARLDSANAAQDALIAAPGAAWSTFTPAWTASAGTPAIGNGTLTGRYRRQGKTYDVVIYLVGGSTTTYGTAGAYWIFSLTSMAGFVATQQVISVGGALAIDTGTIEYAGFCRVGNGATTVELFKPVSGRWTNTSPFTFGNTDVLGLQIRVEST